MFKKISSLFSAVVLAIMTVGCAVDSVPDESSLQQPVQRTIRHFELDGSNPPRVWDEKVFVRPDITKRDGTFGTSRQAVLALAAPSCGNDLMIWSETYGDGELACVSGYGGPLDTTNYFPGTGMMLYANMDTVWNFHTAGWCTFHSDVYPYSKSYQYNNGTWTAPDEVVYAYDVWCYPN